MRIFFFFSGFILGMAIFLLGLRLLGTTLKSVLGHQLRLLLTNFTATKERSVLAGLVGTCLVQSSSAVASTMVILVDHGVLELTQAFGVILGANIGTTLTAQIVALPLEALAWPLMIGGLFLVCPKRSRFIGLALFALGTLFFGLNLTTLALSPILKLPSIERMMLELTDTPLQAAFLGVLLTALVQSSSAVTGLTVRMVSTGYLSLPAGVGIALGSNIGTVVTTLIASFGRKRGSRATAYADFLFNLSGVLLLLPIFPLFLNIVGLTSASATRQVANAHTLFNTITALLALPFLEQLSSAAWWWAGIREKNKNIKS